MKYSIKLFFVLFALLSLTLSSQSLVNKKICVDPGHGGHDPADDRYIPATGLWESDANWDKALHLKPILESFGATVILTRQGNSDADDLALSVRAGIANSNNVDFFNSIHSNGWQGTSNSTLMLFRGYDNQPVFPNAKTMSNIMVAQIYNANRTTGTSVRGDWSFYPDWGTSGLGVLRPLTMPGVLSEGSFHDYIPESWRLLNTHYRRSESWAIAKSYLSYFNAGTITTGTLAGILRDSLQDVSYFYISSTNDRKKPVNGVTVTLQPGNKTYITDQKNNGFYYFDSLAPGTYTLYFNAPGYGADSATVTLAANQLRFVDRWLPELPNYNPPVVTSYQPANGDSNIILTKPIVINFDMRMNTTLAQAAFSITPNVAGNFTWENNNRRMIFTPNPKYSPGVTYLVSIATTAKSAWGVALANNYSFSFRTRLKLNLLSAYPDSGAVNVPARTLFTFVFDAPISASSLGSNFQFVDENNSPVGVILNSPGLAQGMIQFETINPMLTNKTYTINIKPGLKDIDQMEFGETKSFPFTTEMENYVSGQVLDPLETIGQWKDPNYSGSTVGTNADLTTFTMSQDRKISGTYSGKIAYVFSNPSGGVVRTFNATKPSVGSNNTTKVGLWIWGDNSKNNLEYWFYYNTSTNVIVPICNIDWIGWKLKYVPLSQVTGTGEKLFHSVVISQTANGSLNSAIYIDDLQMNIATGLEETTDDFNPTSYGISQNYPNPFNPSTFINYQIPLKGRVSLKVFDLLGKEVETLVDEEKEPGIYRVVFNASKLASGMYFARITSGEFIQTIKMNLLK